LHHLNMPAYPLQRNRVPPNGERYPLVGGTRQRYFAGTNLKPRKLLENAPTPTSRVHAVLGARMEQHAEPAAHFTLTCF
jgi:hypothetical protein